MKLKKLAAIIGAALVLTTSAVCITACGDTGTSVEDSAVASLAGTYWDIIEVSAQGQTMTKAEMEAQIGQSLDMYFYFTDSTVTFNLMGDTETTSYTYENGVVTIEGISSSINGNTMFFDTGSESYKLVKR